MKALVIAEKPSVARDIARVLKCGKNIKTIAIFLSFEYTICNRVARSLLDIGDQAESCAQLFYVKERFYGFEKTIDL